MKSRLRIPALAAAALALTAGCAGAPKQPEPPSEMVPSEPPLHRDRRYDAAAAYSDARGGHALLVVENGEVVYEGGQNGHPARRPHPLHGGTESFWGVLAAADDADGLLALDETVVSVLPEFATGPWQREVRLRQLLHYTSGLEGGVHALHIEAPDDRFARVLELEMTAPPGERFQYGPSHLFLYVRVLERRLAAQGVNPDPIAHLRERILDPIGLEVARWDRDAAGNPDVTFGAHLGARQWAKFGELILGRGRVRGRQILDADALDGCLRGSDANPGFGLALWLNPQSPPLRAAAWSDARHARRFYTDGLPDLVVAAGEGNQRLYVIPSHELVVVRFGASDRSWRDDEFLERLLAAASASLP